MKHPVFAALWLAGTFPAAANDRWPQFRGPNGDGHSDSTNVPVTWSESSNVAWKTAIHDKGWSSPVVSRDQVWVTTATVDGRDLYAVGLDRATGRIVHNLKLHHVPAPPDIRKYNSYASPTPVLEDGLVYVSFGSPFTGCLDAATGRVLWQRTDFVCNHYRGAGSSPILHGDLLFLHFDGSDHQFVVALDKRTGKTVWRKDRSIDYKDLGANGKPEAEGDFRKAFATPHVAEFAGRLELVSQGAKALYGYDPLTGREYWRVEERTAHSAAARPVIGHGLIFVPTGFSKGQLLAVRPGGEGTVLDANAEAPADSGATGLKLAWKSKRSVPNQPSVILNGDLLFMVDDGGMAGCVEALSGREVWRERIGGNFAASPVAAAGRIYFSNKEGRTIVIEAGRQFRALATNQLADGFNASPAIAGHELYLRSQTHLYRIENR